MLLIDGPDRNFDILLAIFFFIFSYFIFVFTNIEEADTFIGRNLVHKWF